MEINPEEKHYTTKQVGEMWGVSQVTAHRMFCDEPGVLQLGCATKRRQVRRELRIPASVLQRVYLDRIIRK